MAADPTTSFYMIELRCGRWSECVDWYIRTLGFQLLMADTRRRFALLKQGELRVALKGKMDVVASAVGAELVFQVSEIKAHRQRIRQAGSERPSPVRSSKTGERYREYFVRDPDGRRVRFFEMIGGQAP